MDWFLYDNDLRHERVKFPLSLFRMYCVGEPNLLEKAYHKKDVLTPQHYND